MKRPFFRKQMGILVLFIVFFSASIFAARLPLIGGDNNNWGDILNTYLQVSHNSDGTLKDDVIGNDQLSDAAVQSKNLASDVDFFINTDDFYINVSSELIGINTTTPTTQLDVRGTVNATLFNLDLESVTNSCTGSGCSTTATCTGNKRIIYGMASDSNEDCDTDPSQCNSYCTIAETSCSITENSLTDAASIYVVCGKAL